MRKSGVSVVAADGAFLPFPGSGAGPRGSLLEEEEDEIEEGTYGDEDKDEFDTMRFRNVRPHTAGDVWSQFKDVGGLTEVKA